MQNKFKVLDESGDRKYFTIIPNYIVNHSTVYEQAIYLYMKRVAGETGTCWTSAQVIAQKLGIARRTVVTYRKKLEKRGWIEIIGRKGKTKQANEYRIVDLWKFNVDFYQEKDSVPNAPFEKIVSQSSERVHQVHLDSVPNAHEEEPIKKNQEEKERGNGRFTPPSLEEINDYCLERKNLVNPDAFFNFYESKGWAIGKNQMKNWRAAVRTWEKRESKSRRVEI